MSKTGKKILAMVLAVTAGFSIIGCGGADSSTEKKSTEEMSADTGKEETSDNLQVAFLTANLANENWQTLTQATINEGAKMGMDVSVTDCAGNPQTQCQHIESSIEAGYDTIILGPSDSNALIDSCKKAAEAGIPVISTDGYFDYVTVVVGADEYNDGYALGVKAGEWVNENWPDKTELNVNVLGYDFLEVCIERKNGMVDGFRDTANAEVTIIADNSVQTAAEANETSESVLQADRIDVCLSVAGDFLYGFCMAAENHGLTNEDVVGFTMDATKQVGLMLQKDKYVKGMMSWGSPVEKCLKILEGCEKAQQVEDLMKTGDAEKVFYDICYIDSENIDQILEDYGWSE